MKKIKLTNKLSLNKETVSRLNDGQMQNVKGGFTFALSLGDVCRWSEAKGFGKADCKARHTKRPYCATGAGGGGGTPFTGPGDAILDGVVPRTTFP